MIRRLRDNVKSVFGTISRSGYVICAVVAILILATNISHAATLSLSPASVKVSSGNIVSVKVLVNTEGQSINTVAASIQFPGDLLQVMSISKSSSILSLWVQDPSFSNAAGTISFTGGVPNPGFSGQSGEIVSIVFKAKKQGTASVIFTDSSVLLNDGLGTDVLSAKKSTSVSITSASSDVPTINTIANSLPAKPIIVSSTNPQQDIWYSTGTATFSWTIPSDVTSIQTLLSKDSKAVPTVTYDSSVSQRTVNNISDGTLYFSLRYVNSIGAGPVATYKIQIDSTPPEKFAADVVIQGVNSIVALKAVDVTSGIDYYGIQIDSEPVIKVQKDSLTSDQFTLPVRNAGNHSLEVTAYDKAGNHTEAYSVYTSPEIVPPTIAVYPAKASDSDANCQLASVGCAAEVARNQSVIVKGDTKYPDTTIGITLQSEGKIAKVYTTKTTADGSYSLQTVPLDIAGPITVWSQIILSNNALGPVSDKVTLDVKDSLVIQTSKSIIYGLPFIIVALALLATLMFVLYYGWHQFFGLKKRIQSETEEVISGTHKALKMFKEELNNQLNKLEKVKNDRDLNKKEEKIFKELQDNVDAIDDFIEKKIRKIK